MNAANASAAASRFEEKVGHPPGLFVLFFAEMWERFSYYGMRALLVFYMMKGFLSYGDTRAYAVYGAYTALVYATPFIGGVLADRYLGHRRAVVIGGALMAAGHLLMTLEMSWAFYGALGLIIAGNGFFKPNVSTMVGGLYPRKPEMRDSGFTIFYMGINLGAAIASILCGFIGEKYGWHWGFGLATFGMIVGLAVFVAPARLTQLLILGGALAAVGGLIFAGLETTPVLLILNGALSLALLVSAGFAGYAATHGSLPDDVGRPSDPEAAKKVVFAGLSAEKLIYLGIVLAVPLLALLVRNDDIAGLLLVVFGAVALGVIVFEMVRGTKIERHRLAVVLILMFFSMLFWAFFEQAGSSVNTFTDRNVDRIVSSRVITDADVGQTIEVEITQAQLGHEIDPSLLPKAALGDIKPGDDGRVIFTMDMLEALRKEARESGPLTVQWKIDEDDVGMKIASSQQELPASIFQSANPIYILIFGLVFSALWGFLGKRRLEPSTPVKFGLGLLQLGLGFGAFWYGTQTASETGMVGVGWLLLGYMLHTTGELCLSPVGLSMVTKLSPVRIVSTVMGGWFLATAFSNYLAAMIAAITGVSHGEEGGNGIPPPLETLHVYGDVFGKIAIAAAISAVIVFVLSPLLRKWMHEEEGFSEGSETGH